MINQNQVRQWMVRELHQRLDRYEDGGTVDAERLAESCCDGMDLWGEDESGIPEVVIRTAVQVGERFDRK